MSYNRKEFSLKLKQGNPIFVQTNTQKNYVEMIFQKQNTHGMNMYHCFP